MSKILQRAALMLSIAAIMLSGCRPPELESAVMAMDKQKFQEAREKAQISVEKYPDNAEAWYLYGVSLFETAKGLDDHKTAFEALTKAKNLDAAQFEQKADKIIYDGFSQNFNKAIKYYNSATALIGTDSLDLVAKEVINFIDISLIYKSDQISSYTVLARSHSLLKNNEEAEKNYKKAVALDPEKIETNFDLGYFYYTEKRDNDAAIPYFEKVTAIEAKEDGEKSRQSDAYVVLSQIYQVKGDVAKTKEAYLKAIETNPEDPNLAYNLGMVFYKEQNWSEAEKYFNMAVEREADNADAYLLAGNCSNLLEKYDAARMTLEKGVELYPDNASLWTELGKAYNKLKMVDKAKEALSRAKELER
jgi:tetratricopeptide (TPR) repeat protein